MAAETEDQQDGERGCATAGKWGCGCLGVLILISVVTSLGQFVFSTYPVASWGVIVSAGLFVGGAIAGGFVGAYPLGLPPPRRMQTAARIVLGFGLACLLTVIGLTLRPTRFSFEAETPANGGTVGPIEVPHDNMRVDVRVHQSIRPGAGSSYQRWSFVTVELLDDNKSYLSSFGGEFWHYAGYDGESWEEEDEWYKTTLRLPSAGTYHARLTTESNVDSPELSSLQFEMYERAWWGNPHPFRYAAYLAFFLGGLFVVAPRVGRSQRLVRHLSDDGCIQYDGTTWRASAQVLSEYEDCMADEWVLQPMDPGVKTPRYLEHEYEVDSNWENWLLSRPVDLEDLTCPGPDGGEVPVREHVATEGPLPETVMHDGSEYALEDAGTVRREGTPLRYHNYGADTGGFLTIEGDPQDSLDAVVGEPISASEITLREDDPSASY